MEIVTPALTTANGVSPFHNHDVREWSRIDNLTGALERARLETDHWSASTNNTAHKYNKVVDSRARSDADGAVQQRARRQLEVFQSSVPGGRIQVIKTHTVSSSRWSTKSTVAEENKQHLTKHFEDLELSLNPLDLSSQKSKAIVGRTGKRPPSRPHGREETPSSVSSYNSSTNVRSFNRISRLCHQIHNNAVKETFGAHAKSPVHERPIIDDKKTKPTLNRTKSSSSEDINLLTTSNAKSNKSIEDLEDLEQLQTWRRASKIRRSLQFPKQTRPATLTKTLDLPQNTGSVRRICEDLETGRRLNTALRGNNLDLEALDQILQSISNSSGSDKNSVSDEKYEEPERDVLVENRKPKRDSFVTVESLQEVKGRLRRTSSPNADVSKIGFERKVDEDADDGIVTEENSMPERSSPKDSRVRSYVYGMETMMNKKTMLGTGSLESRSSKQFGGTNVIRNEDWYNRRKSYGFEQVHNQQDSINSITKRNKTIVDSSTDSGICRSSEIVVPNTKKDINYKTKIDKERFSDYNSNYEENNDSIPLNIGSVRRYTSLFENKNDYISKQSLNDLNTSYDEHKSPSKLSSNNAFARTTITVPIQTSNFNKFTPNSNSLTVEENYPLKRHSIAVDETKYVKQNPDARYSRTTLLANDAYLQDGTDDEILNQNRKSKKVEFCKTEVHFAAESGKVNIVETDEKPPPTNNFRRRRRHSAILKLDDLEKSDLPLLHFGDSTNAKMQFEVLGKENSPEKDKANNVVTISTGGCPNYYSDDMDDDQKENFDNETIKGILKNKPIKPKPYLLGDDNYFSKNNTDNSNDIWGVKLKPVSDKQETPIWKSTVTLKNTLYDKVQEENPNKLEDDVFQMELQKILQNLHQTSKPSNMDEHHLAPQNVIRIKHPPIEQRPLESLLSNVENQTEDLQKLENRGYSTKVHIGHGDAVVLEDDPDNNISKNTVWPLSDNVKGLTETFRKETETTAGSCSSPTSKQQQKLLSNPITKRSPVVLRKGLDVRRQELKTAFNTEKLSSPSLVGQKQNFNSEHISQQHLRRSLQYQNDVNVKISPEELSCSPGSYRKARINSKGSPFPFRKLSSPTSIQQENRTKSPNTTVLRTPRRSEMTYFGVKVIPSPKPGRKQSKPECLDNKPDLLQNTPVKKIVPIKPTQPIYENMEEMKVPKQFDSSILDELTKAADQILQAVNEYAEEVSSKEGLIIDHPSEKLDTISETRSWRCSNTKTSNIVNSKTQPKSKRTSSTSSVDSATGHKKTLINKKDTPDEDVRKKKNGSETSSSSKAAIKARRLQRASSREALLQSHGSSSEDLPISISVRKPRLSRKARSTNSAHEAENTKISNNDIKKVEDRNKTNERIQIGALPEIRHKTAISTIRSTAEKSAMRDRIHKSKQEEAKKASSKREIFRSSATSKSEKSRSISSKEPINNRISTANIKKCHKSEASCR